jgi:hypothetical protein
MQLPRRLSTHRSSLDVCFALCNLYNLKSSSWYPTERNRQLDGQFREDVSVARGSDLGAPSPSLRAADRRDTVERWNSISCR